MKVGFVKAAVVAVLGLAIAPALASKCKANCNNNDCLKQVKATRHALASADCSAFYAASKTTITITTGKR
jgi:hypothetical protein